MNADIPAMIALSARNIRDTGRAYGFEGAGPVEQLFRSTIMELAALDAEAPRTARIAALEASIAVDGKLFNHGPAAMAPLIDQAMERLARSLAFSLARAKVGSVIPVPGSLVSGAVNTSLQGDVSKAARFAFQARRLK